MSQWYTLVYYCITHLYKDSKPKSKPMELISIRIEAETKELLINSGIDKRAMIEELLPLYIDLKRLNIPIAKLYKYVPVLKEDYEKEQREQSFARKNIEKTERINILINEKERELLRTFQIIQKAKTRGWEYITRAGEKIPFEQLNKEIEELENDIKLLKEALK